MCGLGDTEGGAYEELVGRLGGPERLQIELGEPRDAGKRDRHRFGNVFRENLIRGVQVDLPGWPLVTPVISLQAPTRGLRQASGQRGLIAGPHLKVVTHDCSLSRLALSSQCTSIPCA